MPNLGGGGGGGSTQTQAEKVETDAKNVSTAGLQGQPGTTTADITGATGVEASATAVEAEVDPSSGGGQP